jgi:hypothetical protein
MLQTGGSSETDLDWYGSPKKPKRRSPTSFRLASDLERGIDLLIGLWKLEAEDRGDAPDKINRSHVVNRLLRVGLDGAFEGIKKDAGLKQMPSSESEWEQFEQAFQRRLKKR